MLGAYNIDSDEEEEEEVSTNVPKSASTHIQELEKVCQHILSTSSVCCCRICVVQSTI